MSTASSESTSLPEEGSLRGRFLQARSLLSFLLALGILVFFASRLELDLSRIWGIMKGAHPGFFAAGFVVCYLTFPLRGERWRLLLENAGLSRKAGVSIPSALRLGEMVYMSWFANCVIPAKLGDAYRGYQLKRAAGVHFSTAMGTILAERLIDVVVLVIMLIGATFGLGGLGHDNGETMARIFGGSLLLLAIGLVGLGLMWMLRGRLPTLLPQRIQAKYLLFQEGTFGSFQKLPIVLFLSLTIWLGEVGRLFLVVHSLGLALSLPFIVFLALASSLLTVVPFTPGGLGLAEAGITGLLLLGGVEKEVAVATALLDRAISYWSIVAVGFLLFLARRKV